MSQKAIYESDAKAILHSSIRIPVLQKFPHVVIDQKTRLDSIVHDNPWLTNERLVVKPDQLIKRRGKLGLIKVNCSLAEALEFVSTHMGMTIQVDNIYGHLQRFIIEPFYQHEQSQEMYVCMFTQREGDVILFHHEGGINVGDVDTKAQRILVPVGQELDVSMLADHLLSACSLSSRDALMSFLPAMYNMFVIMHFAYLELNPLVVTNNVVVLDAAAKLDTAADFICGHHWGKISFPAPFGRLSFSEEQYIEELDAKSGASLKLTVLNKNGRIWTMVAGGGASVIYSDTICELGGASELANYGEYSGAPTESQTFEYAKTILKLITDGPPHPEGKILIIGGGIANFTNVSATFTGIVKALQMYQEKLREHHITIFVRRGGPNYQEGLRIMREVGQSLQIPTYVYGTETHMTSIVSMALGKRVLTEETMYDSNNVAGLFFKASEHDIYSSKRKYENDQVLSMDEELRGKSSVDLFTQNTKAIVLGLQEKAVQGMLDFDYVCRRESPSVVAIVYPFSGDHKVKFYFGHKEVLIPVYRQLSSAVKRFQDADVLVNFASLRSAYDSVIEALQFPQIKTIAIIAEGIPERQTRHMTKLAREKGVTIIGPATVGGIKPGCFKIGNTGGMLDNILASKLYRPGSVGYVSRSGGMSNELNNIISRNTDGVFEGIAIGGDRFPGTTFIDHIRRYQNNPFIKMIVLLGEIGGTDEYEVCEAIRSGEITKPLVSWCIGTCASMIITQVQFGHANATANSCLETAVAKNRALQEAGAFVPESFDSFGDLIRQVYNNLVNNGSIIPRPEVRPPTVPMDYQWAQELGLIRKPSSFISSVSDERGQELLYAGMPISEVFKDNLGVGGTLGLLWFQRRLPQYACRLIEMCLVLTADHGPAVSGAHNCMVTARAGKDLVSSLCSGLLTIGDRFGGAVDGAARQFAAAYDSNKSPLEFVNDMRKGGVLIQGIGHRVKSINNPDSRVTLLKDYVKSNFPATPLLDYALEVERMTTAKKPNLILNVDGCIGVIFVDLLRVCGCFTSEEAAEYVSIGALNGLFVLGRSIGFIGHFLDQKRLKQGLYRHPWDDITYVMPDHLNPNVFE